MEANGYLKENTNENTIQILTDCIQELEESLLETINIIQLLETTVEDGEEPLYIQRSIHTIEKMLKAVCDKEIERLKATVSNE